MDGAPNPFSTRTPAPPARGVLAERAHQQLREAIVSGALRPNEHLVETEVAARLNVSRTPLRESFARLAAEGLIVSGRRGWIVREYTQDEVREVYEVRAGLEGLAASLAAERGRRADIERIVRIHESHGTDVGPARAVLVRVNDEFHQAIVDAAANHRLHELLGQNRRFFFNHRIAEQFTDDEARSSLAGHAEVVDALLARDARAAESAMRRHIALSMAINLSKLRY